MGDLYSSLRNQEASFEIERVEIKDGESPHEGENSRPFRFAPEREMYRGPR